MKATLTLTIHHFSPEESALVIAKLQQWTEYLQSSGIDATFIVSNDNPPAVDLWEAAQQPDQEPADD